MTFGGFGDEGVGKTNGWLRGQSPAWILRNYGLLGTARWLWRSLPYHLWLHLFPSGRQELAFDNAYGVDTDGVVHADNLGVSTRDTHFAVQYSPSKPSKLLQAIKRIKIDYSRFTFIDIGAGKGRVLLVASRCRFRRVVGVEFSPSLCNIAEQNVRAFKSRAACDVHFEIVCGDATNYVFPKDDLVIYMFNPFGRASMESLIRHLERSFDEAPRTIYVIYWNPTQDAVLQQSAILHKTSENNECVIYSTAIHGVRPSSAMSS